MNCLLNVLGSMVVLLVGSIAFLLVIEYACFLWVTRDLRKEKRLLKKETQRKQKALKEAIADRKEDLFELKLAIKGLNSQIAACEAMVNAWKLKS